MESAMVTHLLNFLSVTDNSCDHIDNERALQVELGLSCRLAGYSVRFEQRCSVGQHVQHTKKQKRDIDLIISDGTDKVAIELKVPLAGRVPETMYDFYGDVAFLEAVVESGIATSALGILLTNDSHFWDGREVSGIYAPLRSNKPLQGIYPKPTGGKNTTIHVAGTYRFVWRQLANQKMLRGGRYVCVVVE